jgi:hypothetical protein
VNRLRPVLDDLISPYQSVFIPGRLIIDNALIAFECIHSLQQVKRLDRHFCDYKLDLSIRCHVETGLSPKMGGMGDELSPLSALPSTSMWSSRIHSSLHEVFGKVTHCPRFS